jgi:hypothetical protein
MLYNFSAALLLVAADEEHGGGGYPEFLIPNVDLAIYTLIIFLGLFVIHRLP